MATFPITSPVEGLPYDMRQTFAGEFVFIKNPYVAGLLDDDSFDPITDTDYPGYHSYTVTSITRAGSTATVTTSGPTPFETGDTVIIAGADQTEYNVELQAITVTDSTHFTYPVTGTPATPATGTITLQGGPTTVPGVAYVDDYLVVGTVRGELHNCNRSDYPTWDPLSFITPEKEPSLLVRVEKVLNSVCALKQWDTEFFYNAQIEPPGSPFLPDQSVYLKLGCADARSVINSDGLLIFVSKRDQNQRSREVHVLTGYSPQKISTPNVERILNASDLVNTKALYLSTAGHQLYVLTLPGSEITLVFDFSNKLWAQWTSLSPQSAKDVIAMTRSGKTVTVIVEDHGYADGDPVRITGANQDGYNGFHNVRPIDVNTFTFQTDETPATPATGTIHARGYDESYLDAAGYATFQNLDVVLGEVSGVISALDRDVYQDVGSNDVNTVPINVSGRTAIWDGGSDDQKIITYLRPIGDRVESSVLLRYSDDDYQTNAKYRQVDMEVARPQISNLGSTKRRSFEWRHTDNTELRLEALEVQATKGTT